MRTMERHIGLEQELFLVDEEGVLSSRADEFLERCWKMAESEGSSPESFVEECAKNIIEINTPPTRTLSELAEAYLSGLDLALRAGRKLGLRLYPLATYPLPAKPALRADKRYKLQALTVGWQRFLHAARCAGVHLHLELSRGTVDPDRVVAHDAPPAAREELLNLYNLGTALDPALIALTRASPFYEGQAPGVAVRTAFYRGNALFGWEGLYKNLPEVGALRPYVKSVEELVELQLTGYREWLRAMDRAGVARRLFFEAEGNALKASWNPVRTNRHGTVELRGIDGNYPKVVLMTATLIHGAANRIRREKLAVVPDERSHLLRVEGDRLLVPGFRYLSKDLFYAATTSGIGSAEIRTYVDSIVEFARPERLGTEHPAGLEFHGGSYKTVEVEILERFPQTSLSADEGLRLVRESCDELEEQVSSLRRKCWSKPEPEDSEIGTQ